MKSFILVAVVLISTCSASLYGAVSTQYQKQEHLGQYSYGYADPNSQKHEARSHDGVTRGSYSYVDGHGHVQSVSYIADPHHGFNAVGTNFPKAPLPPLHHASVAAYAVHPYVYASAHVPYAAVALHNGVPVDTPEVQHAKAAHFAAHAAAKAGHHLYKRSLWGYAPQAHITPNHNGVPLDTPEVQHAKAAHFAAHAKALGHYPAHPNGIPADTPEVAHAKAAHFAAHAAARVGHPVLPVAHSYHIPVIHNGVPIDTPEVQHAKAAHYAALAEASSRTKHEDALYPARYLYGPIHIPVIHNGVPVDTPEVQHARAAHLSALAVAGGLHSEHESYYSHEDDGQYRHQYEHY